MRFMLGVVSHGVMLFIGFALGIYMLPILIAPEAPSVVEVQRQMGTPRYQTRFRKDLAGSDLLHWGEGELSLSEEAITFMGEVAPGPDYKLYLSPVFVENEAQFLKVKSQSLQLGDVKTFNNFIVTLNPDVDLDRYKAVVLWCETFGEFISAGQYR